MKIRDKGSINEKCLRYIYILEIDNRGKRSKFFGLDKIYYTGQTNNLKKRLIEHLNGLNSDFLKKNFNNSRKSLVFVDYIFGNEYDSLELEIKIKNFSKSKKIKLINSKENKLIRYIPLKAIILKKYKENNEQIAMELK